MPKLKHVKDHRSSQSQSSLQVTWRRTLTRVLDIALLAMAVVVICYVAVVVFRVNAGYSSTQDTPDYLMRLQVINGSDEKDLTRTLERGLAGLAELELSVQVVEEVSFGLRRLPVSFVISRIPNLEPARLLAEHLGLDPDKVVYKGLEHNSRQVTATLVLGRDGAGGLPAEAMIAEN